MSQEAQSTAAFAAKKAGQTVGVWLTRVIQDAAASELKHSKELGPTQADMLAQLVASVGALTTEVAEMKKAQTVVPEPEPQRRGGLFGLFGKASR